MDLLRGFLTVPIQFSTLVWIYVNATAPQSAEGPYALPHDFETTASAAQITYRALVKPAYVYAFISVSAFLLLWSVSVFAYMFSQETVAPNTSSFPEVDMSSKLVYDSGDSYRRHTQNGSDRSVDILGYSSMLRDAGLGNAGTRAIVKAVKNHTIRVAQFGRIGSDEKKVVLTTGWIGSQDVESGQDGERLQCLERNKTYR